MIQCGFCCFGVRWGFLGILEKIESGGLGGKFGLRWVLGRGDQRDAAEV